MAYIPFQRVSKRSQEMARQLTEIKKYAQQHGLTLAAPVAEAISGATKNDVRPAIQAVLSQARRGDVLIATEASRIGRNVAQVMTFLEELAERGVAVVVLNLGLTTLRPDGSRDAMAWAMLGVGVVFAQLERDTLRERVKSGLDHAATLGRVGGRPKGKVKTDEKLLEDYAVVAKLLDAKLSEREVATTAQISRNTVAKVRKALAAKATT